MKFKSIRWRLPLNFLGIVGLTVLLLGIVLILVLRTYYSRLERDYLSNISEAIPANILDLLKSENSQAELQAYYENVAFLSQIRIRILDSDGEVLVDTGSPIGYSVALGAQSNVYAHSISNQGRQLEPIMIIQRGVIEASRLPANILNQEGEVHIIETPETTTPISEGDEIERVDEETITIQVTPIAPVKTSDETFFSVVSVYPSAFGVTIGGEGNSSGRRSSVDRTIEIHDPSGLLAYIEFSEGPAYGREVLTSVSIGFLAASVLSIGLSATVGWWFSRRLSSPLLWLTNSTAQFAEGEYSSRVDVDREDEIGTLALTYNRMADKVEATVVALRRFVSDAAHELSTPLTALRTNLELISGEDLSPAQQSYIERALGQAERLEELTTSLLDLSRLDAGSTEEELSQINLAELLHKQSELYASQAEQQGISFTMELPSKEIVYEGRRRHMERVIENLLDNAIKFTPEGGSVAIGFKEKDSEVVVWVEDTGIGIPEDDLPQLFNRFHRAQNASGYPGNGLGLAIVKSIVEGHGGSIHAENLKQGSRFTVNLPSGN
ncbi:MAG: HAMP domain-containing protein [Anaerolineales bacterium]|nr:HAMP domain-containing protein [Anaerolineales bacterium]